MPPAAAQELLTAIQTEKDNSYYWVWNYLYYGLYLVGAWILGLIVFVRGGQNTVVENASFD